MRSRLVVALASLIACFSHAAARAQVGPLKDPIPAPIPMSQIGVKLVPVASGLTAPIFLTVAPGGDGRLFVVDQTGLILILVNGQMLPAPFLDIRATLAQLTPAFPGAPQGLNPGYDERGLLGLAFHPQFHSRHSAGSGKLYTLHNVPITKPADFREPPFPSASVVPNCQEVIAEWQVSAANPNMVDPSSYREILRFDRPEFNHNGGTVAFGPDGLLYAAFGDGGNANDQGDGHNPVTGNAQDLTTILGKMIRIDPLDPRFTRSHDGILSANGQYRIPRDNPFLRRLGAVREVYAYGFRNPFRFSFDSGSHKLVLGDVGQNSVEEVDIVIKGGNYGWNIQEGTFLFDPQSGGVFTNPRPIRGLINPVSQYDHFDAQANAITRMAVIGGFVYRGEQIRGLEGRFVCADLTGFLFDVNIQNNRIEQLMKVGMFIKGIGQDSRKELYILGSTREGPSGTAGAIFQVTGLRPRGHGED